MREVEATFLLKMYVNSEQRNRATKLPFNISLCQAFKEQRVLIKITCVSHAKDAKECQPLLCPRLILYLILILIAKQ